LIPIHQQGSGYKLEPASQERPGQQLLCLPPAYLIAHFTYPLFPRFLFTCLACFQAFHAVLVAYQPMPMNKMSGTLKPSYPLHL
jgi:hypothetical protein